MESYFQWSVLREVVRAYYLMLPWCEKSQFRDNCTRHSGSSGHPSTSSLPPKVKTKEKMKQLAPRGRFHTQGQKPVSWDGSIYFPGALLILCLVSLYSHMTVTLPSYRGTKEAQAHQRHKSLSGVLLPPVGTDLNQGLSSFRGSCPISCWLLSLVVKATWSDWPLLPSQTQVLLPLYTGNLICFHQSPPWPTTASLDNHLIL
jgi:hypothetical protein